MSRLVYEGRTKVYWLSTAPADPTAPTVTEITAGVDVTPFVAKDGVAVNITDNKVDSATIEETWDAQVMGSEGADVTLTCFRDDDDETDGYELFVHGTVGALVLCRFNPDPETDPAEGDKVEVWTEMMMGNPRMMNSATNEVQKFEASFAVGRRPNLHAVVAAA